MKLREFTLNDYEALVDMYYEFCKEVYSDRQIGFKYSYYMVVSEWIKDNKNIVLAVDNNDSIAGFTLSYIDTMNGLTEPIYNGDIAYVKPDKRKTRAAYMLYKNVFEFAKEQGLKIVANGRITGNTAKMIEKHFNVKPTYLIFEKDT